jgi:hypothetical protein
MRSSARWISGAAALALLAGCGGGEPGAGGVTPEEESALDNAAAMLDSNNIDVSADSMVANEADLAPDENMAADGTVSGGNGQ